MTTPGHSRLKKNTAKPMMPSMNMLVPCDLVPEIVSEKETIAVALVTTAVQMPPVFELFVKKIHGVIAHCRKEKSLNHKLDQAQKFFEEYFTNLRTGKVCSWSKEGGIDRVEVWEWGYICICIYIYKYIYIYIYTYIYIYIYIYNFGFFTLG